MLNANVRLGYAEAGDNSVAHSFELIRSILKFGGNGTDIRYRRKRVFIHSDDNGLSYIYGLYDDGIYIRLTRYIDEAYRFLISY